MNIGGIEVDEELIKGLLIKHLQGFGVQHRPRVSDAFAI
jgi:hypothetical protein